jgi:hypothetical protein
MVCVINNSTQLQKAPSANQPWLGGRWQDQTQACVFTKEGLNVLRGDTHYFGEYGVPIGATFCLVTGATIITLRFLPGPSTLVGLTAADGMAFVNKGSTVFYFNEKLVTNTHSHSQARPAFCTQASC